VSSRRITLVSSQLLGFETGGGVGAATTFLAIALARMGHQVAVLYAKERLPHPMEDEWRGRYDREGVGIRFLTTPDVPVEPAYFGRTRAVERALGADPPEVVIAHEYGAPAYIALRLRQVGLAYQDTLFVTYCHGTGRWAKTIVGNPRLSPEMLAYARLEQAAAELSDVVVSPSAYLVEWMRGQGWQLPDTRVVPLVTRSTATGEALPGAVDVNGDRPVERVVFFGRLEKRKGVEPFVSGLNAVSPELLQGVELEFLGGPSKNLKPEAVAALISEPARRALRQVSFETDLDQRGALSRLARPGTLAVIPSLAENSPNVVYECLEARIPFITSATGGAGELVAAEDRPRVLFEPTPEGVAGALERVLVERSTPHPVRPAFDGAEVLRGWAEVVERAPRAVAQLTEPPEVDVIVVDRSTASRERGLRDSRAEWVVFLDQDDVPEPELVDVLLRAQAATGADVVSCGLFCDGHEHLFPGEPGGLGLLANGYGTVALLRRHLVDDLTTAWPVVGDADWPLLARLNAAGARIVSVPVPLVRRSVPPGTLERAPSDGLLVIEALERALPDEVRLVVRLAAGLAAEPRPQPPPATSGRVRQRLKRLAGRFS
jgi:glycosyltransferase involved in cell wall biosynthesis